MLNFVLCVLTLLFSPSIEIRSEEPSAHLALKAAADWAAAIDGKFAGELAVWNDPGAVTGDASRFPVVFELDQPAQVSALIVQADWNDSYIVDCLDSAGTWSRIWVATPKGNLPGVRTRAVHLQSPASCNALRIRAGKGDGTYSITEFQAFSSIPRDWDTRTNPPREELDWTPWPAPLDAHVVDCLRAVISVLAFGFFCALVAAGKHLSPAAPPIWRKGCAMLALLAYLSWSNIFQFHYFSPIHRHEFFHYYLGAKYLPELGYRNLYRCVVAAHAEKLKVDPASIGALPGVLRDLETNQTESTEEIRQHPEICTASFSTDRWKSFTEDMNWFWAHLDQGEYQRALLDHGFNATPVWSIAGSFLSNLKEASSAQMYTLGVLDIALLSLSWLICLRTFGLFATTAALTFWGTNSLATFAWTGNGFLRADWLAMLLLGICALKAERYRVGGALLMLSGLLRLFPLIFFLLPLFKLIQGAVYRKDAAWMARLKGFVTGGALSLFVSVALSLTVCGGVDGWQAFFRNTLKHAKTESTNMVGLASLVSSDSATWSHYLEDSNDKDPLSGWAEQKRQNKESRIVLYLLLAASLMALAVLALRNVTLWEAAIISAVPLGIISLSNYDYYFLAPFGLLLLRHPPVALLLVGFTALSWPVSQLSAVFDQRYCALSALSLLFLAGSCLLVIFRNRVSKSPAP